MKINSGVGRETAHGSIMLSAREVTKALENKWVNLLSKQTPYFLKQFSNYSKVGFCQQCVLRMTGLSH